MTIPPDELMLKMLMGRSHERRAGRHGRNPEKISGVPSSSEISNLIPIPQAEVVFHPGYTTTHVESASIHAWSRGPDGSPVRQPDPIPTTVKEESLFDRLSATYGHQPHIPTIAASAHPTQQLEDIFRNRR